MNKSFEDISSTDEIVIENKLENSKENTKTEYHINGYDVSLVNRNIIVDHLNKEDSLKELIKDMANSPDLRVYKNGVRIIHDDFDNFRDELWKNKGIKDVSIDQNLEAVIKALGQNIFTRVHQLEAIIMIIRDNKYYDEWHKKFNQIKLIENIEQKTKEIDNLFVEIYNKM